MRKVAFVTGGNGITGSAIVEYLARETTSEQWSQIVVTSRSPFKPTVQDPRIVFIALDFTQPPSYLVQLMEDTCSPVTHAYYTSYIHKDDFAERSTANRALFENFLGAFTETAPRLENVTLQTSSRYYNAQLTPCSSPLREEEPRSPCWIDNFYYAQEDFLTSQQKHKKWSYNIIRPQAIIGSTSKPNGTNTALTLAMYFKICKELGTRADMPTNARYWLSAEDVADASMIADLSIFASTNPKCANEAFNVSNGDVVIWRYLWPRLAAYFGAEASSEQVFLEENPCDGQTQQEFSFAGWARDKELVWGEICRRAGIPGAKETFDYGSWQYQDCVFERSWSAVLSLSKARRFGWTGYMDTYESFIRAFQMLKGNGMIPA
ncbi:MAG: hypothetical protein MMC23_001761 [Stictis urceolatum]|nr:hypothetical protein [Stictis urceolata]